jgi:outer membrane protein assembly factor BamB
MEYIASSPIYVNGQLLIIDKFSMTSLNATNGHTNWSFFTGDELYMAPSYADGKIYMMTSQRHIFVLDANNNGSKIATYTTPSGSWSSPTIANGRLYIGNHDWNVYCFANTVTANPPVAPVRNNPLESYLPAVAALLTAVLLLIALMVVYFTRRAKKAKAL